MTGTFPLLDRPPVRLRETRHGALAYFPHDQFVGRSLDLLGEFSESEVAVFRSVLQPGSVAVDVGANIGALTVPMATLVGPSGMVVAMEPQRICQQLLAGNLAINGLWNTQVLQAAAGRAAGIIEVPPVDYDRTGNFGAVSLAAGEAAPFQPGAAAPERVPVRPIDELGLQRLDLLKIDAEGMEIDVVAGATETIRRCRPMLFLENDREDKSPALIQEILALGYRLWWHVSPLYRLQGNFRREPRNPFPGIVSINMVAMYDDRPAEFAGLTEITSPDSRWQSAKVTD